MKYSLLFSLGLHHHLWSNDENSNLPTPAVGEYLEITPTPSTLQLIKNLRLVLKYYPAQIRVYIPGNINGLFLIPFQEAIFQFYLSIKKVDFLNLTDLNYHAEVGANEILNGFYTPYYSNLPDPKSNLLTLQKPTTTLDPNQSDYRFGPKFVDRTDRFISRTQASECFFRLRRVPKFDLTETDFNISIPNTPIEEYKPNSKTIQLDCSNIPIDSSFSVTYKAIPPSILHSEIFEIKAPANTNDVLIHSLKGHPTQGLAIADFLVNSLDEINVEVQSYDGDAERIELRFLEGAEIGSKFIISYPAIPKWAHQLNRFSVYPGFDDLPSGVNNTPFHLSDAPLYYFENRDFRIKGSINASIPNQYDRNLKLIGFDPNNLNENQKFSVEYRIKPDWAAQHIGLVEITMTEHTDFLKKEYLIKYLAPEEERSEVENPNPESHAEHKISSSTHIVNKENP